jgi:competence protein CoiA
MGFHLWELDLDKQVLRLRYLIHEDWHGQVQCLTKIFPFEKGRLLSILRQPYLPQPLLSFQGRMDQQLGRYIAQQLYYQAPKWMELQRQAYERGENLLTQSPDDFYPQVRLPQSAIGFAQIRDNLESYYQDFSTYYKKQQNKRVQQLYPPAFYRQETQSNLGRKALL